MERKKQIKIRSKNSFSLEKKRHKLVHKLLYLLTIDYSVDHTSDHTRLVQVENLVERSEKRHC